MLDSIVEILGATLDIFFLNSSIKTERYLRIEKIIKKWANNIEISIDETLNNDDWFCTISDDTFHTYLIKLEIRKFGRLKVIAVQYQKGELKNKKIIKTKISKLTEKLYQAYGIIEQWKLESQTNTIDPF